MWQIKDKAGWAWAFTVNCSGIKKTFEMKIVMIWRKVCGKSKLSKHCFNTFPLTLNWFKAYLSSRFQSMISALSTLSFGVPQGSPLGQLLFTLYTVLLLGRRSQKFPSNIICTLMTLNCVGLHRSFTPTNSAPSLETLIGTTTYTNILSWMNLNKLLNPLITFLLAQNNVSNLLTLKFWLFSSSDIISQSCSILCSQSWLGFIFDSDISYMCLSDQINSVSKSCHFHIRVNLVLHIGYAVSNEPPDRALAR